MEVSGIQTVDVRHWDVQRLQRFGYYWNMIVWTVWICLDWSLDIDWSDGFILVLFWCLETIFLSGSLLRWDYCGSEEWEAALSLSHTHTRATWCLMCLIRATAHWGPGHSSNQIPRGEILAKHVAHGQVCVLSSVFLLLNMSWHVTAVMGMGMTLAWDMFRNIWWVPVESVKAQWWKRRGSPKLWLPWTKLRSVSLTKSDKC